jgi:hypothetical protein
MGCHCDADQFVTGALEADCPERLSMAAWSSANAPRAAANDGPEAFSKQQKSPNQQARSKRPQPKGAN